MRDPDRIPIVLAAIEREWGKNPDQRFVQLLVNLLRRNRAGKEDEGRVLFALEDGELLTWLHPEPDDERRYIEHEQTERRVGWNRWMQAEHSEAGEDES